MLHEPAAKQGRDPATEYKTRLGLWMFLAYGLIYAGFVAVNLVWPAAMEATVLMGLNLAVVYGFGLIVFALILAVIYNAACMKEEKRLEGSSGGEG
jgi:uncharacterized membrane protein (DUF485 family)